MIARHRRRTVQAAAIALLAALAAVSCSSSLSSAPAPSSTRAQTECGRTPGTAGIWRPQFGYCEY